MATKIQTLSFNDLADMLAKAELTNKELKLKNKTLIAENKDLTKKIKAFKDRLTISHGW